MRERRPRQLPVSSRPARFRRFWSRAYARFREFWSRVYEKSAEDHIFFMAGAISFNLLIAVALLFNGGSVGTSLP